MGHNPTETEIKRLVKTENESDRLSFETFLPILQSVASKKDPDTADEFIEGLKLFDKVLLGIIKTDYFNFTWT